MKHVTNPNTYLLWEGKLVVVTSIGEGKTIHMRNVGVERCLYCGHIPETTVLEHSPLFQDSAKPVDTLVI